MIPQTFEQWLDCIVNRCKITITADFAKRRLAKLRNTDDPGTQRFIDLYGANHLNNLIYWYSIYEH